MVDQRRAGASVIMDELHIRFGDLPVLISYPKHASKHNKPMLSERLVYN